MALWMRIVIIILIVVTAGSRLANMWFSQVDRATIAKINGSAWVLGIAALIIGRIVQDTKPFKDQF